MADRREESIDREGPGSEERSCAQSSRQKKIILLIGINMALQAIVLKVLQNQRASLVTINNFMNFIHMAADRRVLRLNGRVLWRIERESPFVDCILINSHSTKEFTRRLRVRSSTFYYIYSLVAPAMMKKRQGGGIPLEKRVALSINRLGISNYLLGCADLFGMSKSLACIVCRQFCRAVLKYIRPLVVPKFTKEALPRIAAKLTEKHGIPFIMGGINGAHIPIIAPGIDPAPFYNRKDFYSCLLQGIVDTEIVFWDWDFGWCGSLHDYTLFINSIGGKNSIAKKYHPYKLIGDAVYPFRTNMYVPFKGTSVQLEPYKAHWNFIQSSTRIYVERTFGILKGRWRILLRRIECRLKHVADIVGTCICLHNLCIMHKDFADESLVEEANTWMADQEWDLAELKRARFSQIVDYGKNEVSRIDVNIDELISQIMTGSHELPPDLELPNNPDTSNDLKAGVTMHQQLAKMLFNRLCRLHTEQGNGFAGLLNEFLFFKLLQLRNACKEAEVSGSSDHIDHSL